MPQTWQNWPRKGKAGQGWDQKEWKGKGNPQKDKGALPSYDAGQSHGSGHGSSSLVERKDNKDQGLRNALQEFIEQNRFEVPEKLKDYFKTDVGTTLQQDQKELNQKRKISQRLDRLRAALQRKGEQWEQFRQSMRDHLQKEKQRKEEESQELEKAIATTQADLDRALRGEAKTDKEEVHTVDSDIEFMEEVPKKDNVEMKPTPEIQDLMQQTQAGQLLLARQVQEMQQQMSYMASMIAPPALSSPTRTTLPMHMGLTPPPVTPEQPNKRRSPTEPFARPNQSGATQSGPYAKKGEQAAGDSKEDEFLNGLDGYGPV